MRYLMRDGAPFTDGQWEQIDKAVVEEAKKILVGRRFLTLVGPLGARAQTTQLDVVGNKTDAKADFWGNADTEAMAVTSRRFLELATVYADFMVSWRDVEDERGAGVQAAMDAAQQCARREDELIFHGDKDLGIDGLFTAKGVHKVAIGDWSKAENPVMDVAKALEMLADKGNSGQRAMVVGNELYSKLHRIQPGTGMMEIDRVKNLVAGGFYRSSRIDRNKAVLVYCDPNNVDLVVGQDMVTAYLGNEKMDHAFRVMETLVPRVKRPGAIAVLG